MKNEKQLLILLAASLRKGTNAWIPDMVGRRTTLLRTQDEHDITFRLRLEDMFADGDLPPLTENTDSLQALPVNDWIDSTTDVYSDWSDTSPCYGEECDQCEIPDHFKEQKLSQDVLEFLGIQRAKPLLS